MAIESKDVSINGIKFSITSFNARKGLKVKIRIIKYISPFIHLLGLKDGVKKILEQQIDGEIIQKLISKLLEVLDDTMIEFIISMLDGVRVTGREMNNDIFDITFANDYETLYKLIWEVIKHNNFLSKEIIGRMMTPQPMVKVK